MAGKVKSYERPTQKRGPKNVLMGVMEIPLLLWQRTDKNGLIHTELGFEVKPGDIRKFPDDLWAKSPPVGDKLQAFLLKSRHPELVKTEEKGDGYGQKVRDPGARRPRANLPPDINVFDGEEEMEDFA